MSIEAQTAALQEWAKENHHKVVGVYTDAGVSARKPASKRPELQRLLNDVRAGMGEMIVFTKLDRWFRSVKDYYKVQDILEAHNVNWKTIQEDYDTYTASGRLKINIMLSVAQDEADRTSERIKAVNERKRQKLEPLTGTCPPGYKIEGKRYIKDPATKDAIETFFRKYLACGSLYQASRLAEEQYGLHLSYQKANKILNNTAYYGRYFDVDGMTPPYITKEEFDKIQGMRRRVVRKTKHNRVYLFSGLVICGECGQRMGGRVNTNQESFFYNCTSHYMARSGCQNTTNLLERKVETFLMETINEKMSEWKVAVDRLYEQKKQRDYKGEIAALTSKVGKLKDLYLNDLISLEEYKKDQATYTGKIDALRMESASQERPNFDKAEKLLSEGWETTYRSMSREGKQEFWRILIKEIIIYPDRHMEYTLNS